MNALLQPVAVAVGMLAWEWGHLSHVSAEVCGSWCPHWLSEAVEQMPPKDISSSIPT